MTGKEKAGIAAAMGALLTISQFGEKFLWPSKESILDVDNVKAIIQDELKPIDEKLDVNTRILGRLEGQIDIVIAVVEADQ